MANRNNKEREDLIDKVTEAYIRGIVTPYSMMKEIPEIKNYQTAENYIEITKDRLDKYFSKLFREDVFKRELASLGVMESLLWGRVIEAKNNNEFAGLINSILKVKAKRVEMMGVDRLGQSIILAKPIVESEAIEFGTPQWKRMIDISRMWIQLDEDEKRRKALTEVTVSNSAPEEGGI